MLTLLNLGSGFASILFSINEQFTLAATALGFCLLFDFFDGLVARRANKASQFGTELDSLADIVSFGIAPIIFGYFHIATTFAIAAYFLNLSAGVFRLARYNVLTKNDHFVGMPIPMNAVILLALIALRVPELYWPWFYLLSGILMASPFTFVRPWSPSSKP